MCSVRVAEGALVDQEFTPADLLVLMRWFAILRLRDKSQLTDEDFAVYLKIEIQLNGQVDQRMK
jgi:DNA-binding transcriptional regulator YiaG